MTEYPIEGQRIVCIDDDWIRNSNGYAPPPDAPTRGSRWTVSEVRILDPSEHLSCYSGVYMRLKEHRMWWAKEHFRPLDQIDELADSLARVGLLEPV
jgi:hypothetical protein